MSTERIGSQGIGNFDSTPTKEAEAFSNVAFIFPGQGSQRVGMGKTLYDNFESARQTFARADEVLGYPLSKMFLRGEEEDLRDTQNAQPALLTVSFAAYRVLKDVCGDRIPKKPLFVAGHSVGEIAALVVAKALSFDDALRLTRLRGILMKNAGEGKNGRMAAIIGLDASTVEAICQQTDTEIANVNSKGQIVISGIREHIAQAIDFSKAQGAKMARELQVSGAFHSRHMRPAVPKMAEMVERIRIKEPEVSVISNVSAKPLDDAQSIGKELPIHLISIVQWAESIEYMIRKGVKTFVEVGEGDTLVNLLKRGNPNVKGYSALKLIASTA